MSDKLEMALVNAADREGVTVTDLATDLKALKRNRISRKKLTPAIIHRASELARQLMDATMARVHSINSQSAEIQGSDVMATATKEPKAKKATKETKVAKAEKPAKETKPVKEAKAKREPKLKVFGKYSATSVIRWMASKGWKFEDIVAVLEQVDAEKVKDVTVRIQMSAGKKFKETGESAHGAPAEITAKEAKELNALRK